MLLRSFDFSSLAVFLAALPGKQTAYLDPGSGSFILQVVIASLVGIGFTIRAYWGKITKFFRKDAGEIDGEDLDLDDE
jgi:hypothetical protein